jgi:hypothetical protein
MAEQDSNPNLNSKWGCGVSVGMWWLCGDVVAQRGCGGSVGDVVAQLVKATGRHQTEDAAVPSSNPAPPTVS